jgi:membrane-associated phospholipid phosphatase
MGELRPSELVSLAYFATLAVIAWLRPVPQRARYGVTVAAAGVWLVLGLVGTMEVVGRTESVTLLRDWLPLAFLLLAYWSPSALVIRVNTQLERWLLHSDARFLSSRVGRALLRLPRPVRELLELSYAIVYPLVPIALALLVWGGFSAEVDRFWSAVLTAEYICYGFLPFLPTRPPRRLDSDTYRAQPTRTAALNRLILDRASNQWNTFPSGHVAGAVACGLVVVSFMPVAGTVLIGLALLIATGSVVGRYHYAADTVTGAAVALVVFVLLS